MTSLANKAILSGADNRPPMLEKDMYDSWKSRMELYMLNRQHGRMILESVESGPVLWPTIEENGVTRTMDTTIEQQAAVDEALVPHSQRDMLHICPRVHGQYFDEPLFEEEILAFIHFLGHGAAPPKPKASVRRTRSSSDTSITPPTAAASPRLTTSLKLVTKRSMQQTHISQASSSGADKETGADNEGKDDDDEETRDEESFDPILKTPKNSDDEGNGDDDLSLNIGGEERHIEEEKEDELYRDVNINQGRGLQTTLEVEGSHVTLTPVNPDGQQQSSSVSSQFVTSMLNLTLDVGMESIFETTSQMDVQTPTSVASLPMTAPTMTPSTIATITTTSQAPILPTTVLSTIIQNLPNFSSLFRFDDRLRTLEANFLNSRKRISLLEQSLPFLGSNEQSVNEQLEAKVLTQSSHSPKTSYAVAADLSEMELKKILIEKMEGNKSIQRSDEQRNLYKALVEGYESNKIILDTYKETFTLKRRRDDDADKDEESFPGPDRGSKRRREGKEPESASAPMEIVTSSAGRSAQGSQSLLASASESAFAEKPVQTTCQMEEPSHPEFDTELEYHLEEVFKATIDQLDWVNPKGQLYPHNLLKPLPLLPNNRGRRVIPFQHFINNDLEYLRGGASSRKYTTSIMKTKATDYEHIKWIEDLVPRTMWIEEPIGYDKHALRRVSH
nr:hypothetical protein [Tanacetum cinerariifolium]